MQSGLLFSWCLLALGATVTATLPPGMSWTDFITKPGVPAMSTISVPYMPKSSPFFPKFVDPKTMIAKKTGMLTNMFSGMGPVMYPPMYMPMYANMPMDTKETYGGVKRDVPVEEPTDKIVEPKEETAEMKIEDTKEVKRGAFGPMGPSFGPMGMKSGSKFGPMGPKFSSKFASPYADPASFYGKSTWSRRRRSVESALEGTKPELKNLGPPPAYPGLTTIPEESEADLKEQLSGTPKEYMPGMFGPYGPFGPVVDPSVFVSKKTTFLDQLFKSLASTTPGPFDPFAPKSTIVPPSFWIPAPFAPVAAAAGEKTPSAS